MEHKGFTIEVYHDLRGQWRFRLRKADGSSIRMPNDPVESSQVISRPYMDKEHAIEQAKALIDAFGVS